MPPPVTGEMAIPCEEHPPLPTRELDVLSKGKVSHWLELADSVLGDDHPSKKTG